MKINSDEMHRVDKLWGEEIWIVNNEKYCGKILRINEGRASSFHVHHLKDEVMYVTKGILKIIHGYAEEQDAETTLVNSGEAFHIPVGLRHRLVAHEGSVELHEFSTQHFDSDSIKISIGY